MDGLDVAKYANTMKGEMPSIVLVSGYHYQDDPVIRQAIADGIICRFLAKPFTNEELLSILIDFLPQ
jgi:CheY-like chemotaxis protein